VVIFSTVIRHNRLIPEKTGARLQCSNSLGRHQRYPGWATHLSSEQAGRFAGRQSFSTMKGGELLAAALCCNQSGVLMRYSLKGRSFNSDGIPSSGQEKTLGYDDRDHLLLNVTCASIGRTV